MAGECIPFHEPGKAVTCHANVTIGGRRLCRVVGTRVDGTPRIGLPAAAGAQAFGVTAWDAAAGEKVGVYATPGIILPIIAGAAIVADTPLMVDVNGAVVPWVAPAAGAVNYIVGKAVDDAAAGAECPVQLRLT